ncbi:hypothetical protein [Halalkalicoccus sp. NIPERK01]|uniref:hypothetical protein n=1 Tax=Halalkalicoccus sp. NIPERK01 TaxID=3053469 RepID=UPI00256F0AE8|nr:hypothetical protein [Halalkalicoccus sp. NIPERK01]MDL5363201.1 hypothetical protein [Halalkalicoccus sp. NIPERK01]
MRKIVKEYTNKHENGEKGHDVGWSVEIVHVGVGLSVDVLERLVAHKLSVVSVAPQGRETVRVAVM